MLPPELKELPFEPEPLLPPLIDDKEPPPMVELLLPVLEELLLELEPLLPPWIDVKEAPPEMEPLPTEFEERVPSPTELPPPWITLRPAMPGLPLAALDPELPSPTVSIKNHFPLRLFRETTSVSVSVNTVTKSSSTDEKELAESIGFRHKNS